MDELMTTICNSIIAILTALSEFDIMAVNPNKLAVLAEATAYIGRAVYHLIRIAELIATAR
jgi:hypothetical protein